MIKIKPLDTRFIQLIILFCFRVSAVVLFDIHLDLKLLLLSSPCLSFIIACPRDSSSGTIGNSTNDAIGTIGNRRTLNVSRQPVVPLVLMLPLVESLVPLVVPMVSKVI